MNHSKDVDAMVNREHDNSTSSIPVFSPSSSWDDTKKDESHDNFKLGPKASNGSNYTYGTLVDHIMDPFDGSKA